jgi:kojibiose phosphorylase
MHAANDNAYTNYLARWVLSLAEQLATRARRDRRLAAVMRRVRVTAAEVRIWRRLARIILVPYDPARNLVLQSRDFEDKAPIDFATYWRDRRKLFGMQVSQERLYRSRALKQADVLMLMQLFRTHFTDAQIQTAMAYYEPYTTHDSSLSTSTHAIVAARLGDIRKAWDYFTRARGIDFAPRSTGAAEGVHAANAGALWQCVVIGFLGLTPAYLDETFSLAPLLPRHWRGVHATLHWRGARIRVEARPFATTITANTALRARVYDRVVRCRPGIPVTVAAPAPASEG